MIEINQARGQDNMGVIMAAILDRSIDYRYIDKNETLWVFSFTKLGDDEGWFVFMTRPGMIEICIGRLSEKEVAEKLAENPPLTKDDLIDLELWMKNGGLESLQPRKKEQ